MALNRWLGRLVGGQGKESRLRRLEAATAAALRIQTIELRHFQGDLVRLDREPGFSSGRLAMVASQFRQAMAVCKRELPELQACRREWTPEQLQQLQLVEEVVGAYRQHGSGNVSRDSGLSQAPEMVPRSLLGLFSRIRNRLAPGAEAATVAGFRRQRDSTLVSLRILLLLVLMPLLFQQFSRTLLVGPLVDRIAPVVPVIMYTRGTLEERAVEKLRIYKEELEFEALLRGEAVPSIEDMQSSLRRKADELQTESERESTTAIKNLLSDGFGVLGFAWVCILCREELRVLRSFFDEIVYGLSDSAKAFVIILFMDMFVGYHSPEGWNVVLQGISRHLGLPPNPGFIGLFVATFPVILATIFKYWIFRYLNRVSPSSVATLRNMNGGG
ncbi:proton extrusion protein PcxA [Candidatus Synechococcus spongiarum]|uniref:Proton extrusion protein PxcA n=1 Tax=Candidatus Synechococcus spongiarum LMB bulk15N TaxID=1943583 RepID=A0A1T1CZX1_9SYNE|nr:proton extrusion protein PcxA [Candidatus Synechococcus spongiarum]OOV34165.1 proton extrusion protein PcxA [Candidatus Synechococcus spongiarum LMB bulk15N]